MAHPWACRNLAQPCENCDAAPWQPWCQPCSSTLQAASQPSCLSSRRVSRGLVPPSPLLHNRKARRVAVDACVAAECVPLALHLSCLFAHTLGVGRRPLLARRALWRWSTWCKVRLAEDDGRRGVQVRQRGPEGEARAMRTRRLCGGLGGAGGGGGV